MEKYLIPVLVKLDCQRSAKDDGTLPFEQMKLDKLYYGKIGFSETMEYGEVEIREEGNKVLIAITGTDYRGAETASEKEGSITPFKRNRTSFSNGRFMRRLMPRKSNMRRAGRGWRHSEIIFSG